VNSPDFDKLRIVLVETSHPGNIGAAARAMKNMGLSRLVLVNPKPKAWPAREALSMAASALDVLDRVQVVATLEEAIADCHLVLGTSARLRHMPVQLLEPVEAATHMAQGCRQQQQVALVFGREDRGLSNEELHLCHYHVHIPVNPDYPSLNLAAAVMVLGYEVRKALLAAAPAAPAEAAGVEGRAEARTGEWDQLPATAAELERYLEHLEQVLVQLEFLDPGNPRQLMRRLRRLYQRIQPDRMEINILRGILSATQDSLARKERQ